jgi:F-type H+-transporting ATPase subunit epsilon
MANLTHASLVTPERVLFSGEAEAVVMRTDGGDITFLANHMDYIAAVDICVVRFEGVQAEAPLTPVPSDSGRAAEAPGSEPAPSSEVRAAVHGGFVMVADNKVTIVSGVAELADEIDVPRARRALASAEAAGGDAQAGAARAPETAADLGEEAREVAARNAAAARARARLEAAAQLESELTHI